MNKELREYLRKLGRKGGKVKSVAKARAARENGKKGGLMKKVMTFVVGIFLTSQLLAEPVKTYAPGTPEYERDGAIVLEIFRGRYDKAKAEKNRFKLGKLLYPNGYTSKEIGILDKDAGGDGMVKFHDGRKFDRDQVHKEIAKKAAGMTDAEALQLRQDLNGR